MASKISLNRIALVGANGNVGSHILSALQAKNRFQITAISRVQSKTTFPSDISVARVNYDEPETLVNALKGQDALIITMSVFAHDAQEKLIRAAAQAGVAWILPNEFGMFNTDDVQNETTGSGKQRDRALIEKLGVSSWIGMTCGFWYEYSLSGGQYGIDLNKREVVYFDDGNQRLNTTTWPQTGLAVANLLSLPLSSTDGKGPTLEPGAEAHQRFGPSSLDAGSALPPGQGTAQEQEDLLVLLDEVNSKRRRDKDRMREKGMDVSEDEDDGDEDEDEE